MEPPKGLMEKRKPTVVTYSGDSAESPSLTLEYFALRGLGELPRLILEATGTAYHCVFHYSSGGYKAYATFGQLPVLRDGDLLLVESAAIARHLARRTCIDGTTLEEKAKVDMYHELANDIKGKIQGVYGGDDAKPLANYLKAAEAACDGEHFVGSSLTLADVAMFHMLHWLVELKPSALDEYRKLSSFVNRFKALPNISRYLDSPRRVPMVLNDEKKGPLPAGRWPGLDGYAFVAPMRTASYKDPWSGPP